LSALVLPIGDINLLAPAKVFVTHYWSLILDKKNDFQFNEKFNVIYEADCENRCLLIAHSAYYNFQ